MSNFLHDSIKQKFSIEVDGTIMDMPYLIFAPNGYESMEALPIVLYLHDNNEIWSDESSDIQLLQKILDDKSPCIILAPKTNQNWCDWQPATVAIKLAKEVMETYKCDVDRLYIIGVGMGAFAVYDFIGHESDNNGIAAAVTIGGAYMFELVENIKNVPLWVFYGASDFEPENYSLKMIDELNKAGGANHTSTDYSNSANRISFICNETDMVSWLLAQKRGKRSMVNSAETFREVQHT